MMKGLGWGLGLGFIMLVSSIPFGVESRCSRGCGLALASYYVWQGTNVSFIAEMLQADVNDFLSYNLQVPSKDNILWNTRVNVPFSCDCISGDFLGHVFQYNLSHGGTYDIIAETYYSNLTTARWLQSFNSYPPNRIPDNGFLNVTVNCSCGDSSVSEDYGLFVTYPLRANESLRSIVADFNISRDLLQRYNPGTNFTPGRSLVYIPAKDKNGIYPRLVIPSSGGISGGAIAGISIAAIFVVVLLAAWLYIGIYRKKKVEEAMLLSASADGDSKEARHELTGLETAATPGLAGITVDKSVEFSYEELAKATNDFSLSNKIGEGGFGSVYYAELRGEKAAIKKMDMQASKEFLAELKVLTHVHHLNLVRLIGYCVEGSLFLVYEYIENGNLSQHLRGSGRDPLLWSTRVQIALDSARGLEYIHEHTVPVYIHRDIKSANILIDKNFHAKVADFGLTKLTEVGNVSLPTRLVGTFGYMPPEYAQYGDVSPKIDVFAFGVVMYELISAKEAIVKMTDTDAESKGLVGLFEGILNQPDPRDDLRTVVDPRLEGNYPLDSVYKMALLAKACTQENPQLRPSMRQVVVALMTLSSTTDDWDVGSFYDNQALVNLMSGR